MVYVIHVCKNSTLPKDSPDYCNNCWIDVDKHNATTNPPIWKYCSECVKKGYKNPRTRKNTMTSEQVEAFKERMKQYREQQKERNKDGN